MKKTISTNISGILFHIEEDGYTTLRKYLDTITFYFSTFEDSKEIIADIESRIAEIFLSKLNTSKQVITEEDVASLILTMGNVNDFKASEDAEEKYNTQKETINNTYSSEAPPRKKLYRDPGRKLLGGVAAGFGRYFQIDPIWIRLILLALFFGLWFIHSMTFITLLAYVALWILLPENLFEEDKKTRKLFRNPDERISGGVCSGLAAYFQADINLIRVLFAISIFVGGAGILFYLILWAMVPQAKTMTDRMQMEGEPVTLSNIAQNIKRELNIKDGENEHVLIKIFLAPFRFIAAILFGSATVTLPAVKVLGEIIRVGLGLGFFVFPILLIAGLFFCFSILSGYIPGYEWIWDGYTPLKLFFSDVPKIILLAIVCILILPLLSIALAGISLLTKRRIFHRSLGWAFTLLFLISVVLLAITIPPFMAKLLKSAKYEKTASLPFKSNVLVLKMKENATQEFSGIKLKIIGTLDSTAKLVQAFSARGKTRQDALEHAREIRYDVNIGDSTILFSPNFIYNLNSGFRNQDLQLYLYLPKGQKVLLDESMKDLLPSYYFEKNSRNNLWVYSDEKMTCMSCSDSGKEIFTYQDDWRNTEEEDEDFEDFFDFDDEHDSFQGYNQSKHFSVGEFSKINAGGMLHLSVRKGDEFKVLAKGKDSGIDALNIHSDGEVLQISMSKYHWWRHKDHDLSIEIVCPHLKSIQLSGATESEISGFDETDLRAKVSGASIARMNIHAGKLALIASGASKVFLEGSCEDAEININGASKFNGYDFNIKNADISITGASNSEVYVSEVLKIDASGASKVKYKGHPHLIKSVSGLGKVYEENEHEDNFN